MTSTRVPGMLVNSQLYLMPGEERKFSWRWMIACMPTCNCEWAITSQAAGSAGISTIGVGNVSGTGVSTSDGEGVGVRVGTGVSVGDGRDVEVRVGSEVSVGKDVAVNSGVAVSGA